MDYNSYKFLDIVVDDGIACITINRPEAKNACDREGHSEFARILTDLARDDDVRAAVVTGAGRTFSVGGELELLEHLSSHPEDVPEVMDEARGIVNLHIALDKPIIAAINGVAMGAGLAFAMMCDWVVVERQARLADGHIRVALAAGDHASLVWPMCIGLMKSKRYLLTGDSIGAEEAERLGLVTEVVDEGMSLQRAMAVARRLADGPQTAIRHTKRSLNQWLRVGAAQTFEYSLALEFLAFSSSELKNALQAIRADGRTAISPEPRTWGKQAS